MQPDLTTYWTGGGEDYRFDLFIAEDFSSLEDVKTVNGLVLNTERTSLLLVLVQRGAWILPGGGVEPGETLLDTLVREVKEETNRLLRMETVKPLFYQHVYQKDPQGRWSFLSTQVRYQALVAEDHDFVSDPDGDVAEARWVPLERLGEFLDWGTTTRFIQRLLLA